MATKRITVESIGSYFESLPDPRHTQNRKHRFIDVVVVAVCGRVCGCDGPTAIRRRATDRADWLSESLALPNGIPSRDRIRDRLMAIRPDALPTCFRDWIATAIATDEGGPARLVDVAGKTLRRSHDASTGVGPSHIVSAWAREHGVASGQVATEEKSDEITAIPQLLKRIGLHKTLITIDAMGCRKDIARDIVAGGGDFVIAVTDNQPELSGATGALVVKHPEGGLEALKHRTQETDEHGHGRRHEGSDFVAQVPADFAPTGSGRGSRPSARRCGSPRTPTGVKVMRCGSTCRAGS